MYFRERPALACCQQNGRLLRTNARELDPNGGKRSGFLASLEVEWKGFCRLVYGAEVKMNSGRFNSEELSRF